MQLRLHLFLAMGFYWVKTRWFIKKFFGGFIWNVARREKTVYLTFDDGPIPQVTPWVLDVLKRHDIKATFFCIGDNIEKHPEVFEQVIAAGHAVGNHTFNHVNGWVVDDEIYVKNAELCQKSIEKHKPEGTRLFRPPYGKMSRKQASAMRHKGFKLIMWDVLSADFDQDITPEKCLKNVINNVENGSIIIFHDSEKARRNLQYALPRAIEYLKRERYRFGLLPY
ncbi:polysaccharide deacetylase family protein [Flavobacterium sp. RHBU_3]|uniref:polysaccharide deacetylase family protein n=1 Tax=Flavobacterium sp. RHBU_3 TaxID=3391184 RepID=UPI003985159B